MAKAGAPAGKSIKDAPAKEKGKTISAVSRAFVVVEKLALVSSSSLEDLAKATRLAKPTVYRFLLTLRELGYVKKDDSERWFLTMKLFSVGSRALDHIELPTVAKPVAARLSAELGETVHMGILDEDKREAFYILKIESKCTIRMYSRVGKTIPLYCTAIGKMLLSDQPPKERAAAAKSFKYLPFTPHTVRDPEALEAELQRIAAAGVSADAEEHEEGIICLAAPIRGHDGRSVAAISASWPKFRFDAASRPAYEARIKAAAAEISAVLGWEGA